MSTKKRKQPKENIKENIEDNVFRPVKLNIKPFNLTDKQKSLVEVALRRDTKIIFINGVAGSSKTFLSVYSALHMLNMNPKYEIKYIRTIAESGERAFGALPGTVDEKFNPFMMPLYDKLDELLPIAQSKYLEGQGYIEALPVNFLRGATWNDKIVIADECFEDSVVLETDKGQKTLKTILKNPSLYKVLSFDENKMKFVFNKVLNTFNKGEQYISEIVLDGRSKIRSTKNHRYLTNHGWRKLEDLKIGDAIISSCKNNHVKRALNNDQKDLIFGSILGDGSIYMHTKNSARLTCVHGIKQENYAAFKAKMFGKGLSHVKENGFSKKPAVRFSTKSFYFPIDGCLYDYAINNLNLKSLAIAWQDDGYYDPKVKHGYLWSCATDKSANDKLAKKINELGFDCCAEEKKKKDKTYYVIRFRNAGFDNFSKKIAPFIDESMAYKIPEKYSDLVGSYIWNSNFEDHSLRIVTDIKLDLYKNNVYDIEVENAHNFVVSTCKSVSGSKVVAHNCQNYSAKELITLLTRIGENTKLFICGDAMQSDIGSKSGFTKIYDVFNNEESENRGIYCFQFEEEDIMRSEILKYIVHTLKKLDKPASH